MKIRLIILFVFLSSAFLFAQTGPGGVGSTTACGALKLWLDANSGVTLSTNTITLWSDRSASCADNATPPAATNRPTLVANTLNGFPVVRFDGVDDYFDISNSANMSMTQWSMYIVGKVTTNKDYNYWFGKGNDGAENYEFLSYAAPYMHTPILFTDASRGFLNTSNPTAAVNSYSIWQYDFSSSGRAIYLNGSLNTSDAVSKTPQTNTLTAWLGNERTQSRYFNGDMAEVIMFSTLNNPAERIIIQNYLSAKYNLTLASNDKYAGDAAGTDYDYGVSGIGRETGATNVSTSFATSICGGMGMTSNSGFGNNDYVMAGYQNTNNWEDNSDVGGMTGTNPARWLRDWYVDITDGGATVSVDITFDISDGTGVTGITAGTATTYVLLYRAGTSGNWTELVNGSSVSGDRVTFTGVSLTNDGYYTIGTRDKTTASLPIQLLNFSAQAEKKEVNLKWTTATETNNKFFTIERSSDGINFTAIKTVNSKASNGNSLSKLDYETKDNKPLSGSSYYRLRQTDYNGKTESFNIVAVNFEPSKNITFTVYPNPGEGQFTVDFTGIENNHEIEVYLTDLQGKEVYKNIFTTDANSNSFNIIPSQKIAKGTYLCTLVVEGIKHQVKVIVN